MDNQTERNAEIAKIQEQMTKAQEDINAENTRPVKLRAQVYAEAERLKMQAWRLNLEWNASNAVHQQRYYSRLPPGYKPT